MFRNVINPRREIQQGKRNGSLGLGYYFIWGGYGKLPLAVPERTVGEYRNDIDRKNFQPGGMANCMTLWWELCANQLGWSRKQSSFRQRMQGMFNPSTLQVSCGVLDSLPLTALRCVTGAPSTIDALLEAPFGPWNPAHRPQHLPKWEQGPNPSKIWSIIPGKSLNVLNLLFGFCSFAFC